MNPNATNPIPESETDWPLTPADPREVKGVLSVFASSVVGGAMVLFGVGVFLPSTTHTMGATPGMRIDRQRQQRCMELGITPEALAALERAEAESETR